MAPPNVPKYLSDKGFTFSIAGERLLVTPASRLSAEDRNLISCYRNDLYAIFCDQCDLSDQQPVLPGCLSTNFELGNPDGEPASIAVQRRPARPVHPRNLATVGTNGGAQHLCKRTIAPPATEWDPEMIELIAWVKTAQLPPAPFFLGGPHCQVLDTEGFRQGVLTDIDQGPDRPDYRVSILRKELLLLKEMCEGLSAEGGPRQEK